MTVNWTKLFTGPSGAQPRNFVMKIGLWAMGLFTLGFFLFNITWSESDPQTEAAQTEEPALPSDNRVQSGMNVIAAQKRRIEATQAEDAAEALRQQQAERLNAGRRSSPSFAGRAGDDDVSDANNLLLTEEEWKLQESLRLEEIERRARSLRSDPLVKSERTTASASTQEPAPAAGPSTKSLQPGTPTPQDEYLKNLKATIGLFSDAEGGEPQNQLVPPRTGLDPASSVIAPATPRDYGTATRLSQAVDPPGWERVHEGSFLEAVLVTQLSGDFPGPVLAQVAVPFYSRDRQQVLIPRGARVVGTATAVSDRDQARLAIGFHRLIFPDGRWIVLSFHGLNQAGESGLKDRVNRHYLQLFAATGAVGVISGLTLQGSNPYSGGGQGFRAGAGQGFGRATSQILQRFLNRLPTITIRAGQRLRIWFTSDALLPRPARA